MKRGDEKKNSKKETDEITNQEKEVKRRQNGEVKSRNRSAVQRPLNLRLKSRLCLDVIYPDYIYTWK